MSKVNLTEEVVSGWERTDKNPTCFKDSDYEALANATIKKMFNMEETEIEIQNLVSEYSFVFEPTKQLDVDDLLSKTPMEISPKFVIEKCYTTDDVQINFNKYLISCTNSDNAFILFPSYVKDEATISVFGETVLDRPVKIPYAGTMLSNCVYKRQLCSMNGLSENQIISLERLNGNKMSSFLAIPICSQEDSLGAHLILCMMNKRSNLLKCGCDPSKRDSYIPLFEFRTSDKESVKKMFSETTPMLRELVAAVVQKARAWNYSLEEDAGHESKLDLVDDQH